MQKLFLIPQSKEMRRTLRQIKNKKRRNLRSKAQQVKTFSNTVSRAQTSRKTQANRAIHSEVGGKERD